jgi:hypothetical protein
VDVEAGEEVVRASCTDDEVFQGKQGYNDTE